MRVLSILVAVVLSVTFLSATPANAAIKVIVDEKPLQLQQEPIIENGTTLVPMRAFYEAIGAKVKWIDEYQIVASVRGQTVNILAIDYPIGVSHLSQSNLAVPIGNAENYVLPLYITNLELKPRIVNGSTYIPLRYVGSAFDCKISWDGNTETITVVTKPNSEVRGTTSVDEDVFNGFADRWPIEAWNNIRQSKVVLGMNASQVRLALGKPTTINKTIVQSLIREQWVYRWKVPGEDYTFKTAYVYLDNGIVTGLQSGF